ncbi:uncharacterized protein F4822DRAFT_433976 [Hypoxylon trugodes]|uniref:uncharacterized protein n=1 Tax=Hypoxylon trugodes TaxID=326681 RepID=UPI002196152B|nr:uncharacterized protein F4822DRAFT_433976 [Hypoxylon trugodes]KAI1384026.1 hypothetical protein F4822DRAFT_433976 [Hypoxylon trugodes]
MADKLIVDVIAGDKTTQGHTKKCVLEFNCKPIWGYPKLVHCHENTTQIAEALTKADSRFVLYITERPHSVEGHAARITIKKGNTVYLDKLHTHDNMIGLRDAINKALEDDDKK